MWEKSGGKSDKRSRRIKGGGGEGGGVMKGRSPGR